MNVKQLIKALQSMPQNAEVGYAHGDNSEHEVAGWCIGLQVIKKAKHENTPMSSADRECLDSLPDTVVVIRG